MQAFERMKIVIRRYRKIICIAVLPVACGTSSVNVDENPDRWEDSDTGDSSDMERLPGKGGIGEKRKTLRQRKNGQRGIAGVRCRR